MTRHTLCPGMLRTYATTLIVSIIGTYRTHAIVPLTNIGDLFAGYNMFTGNPFSSVDPGIARNIFLATYTNGSKTPDGQYLIPDGVQYHAGGTCSYISQLNAYSKMTSNAELQGAVLSNTVGLAAGTPKQVYLQAVYTSSQLYDTFESGSTSTVGIAIGAQATCSVYTAFMGVNFVPSLDPDFQVSVLGLNASDPFELLRFVQNFGTHYITQITFGGMVLAFTRIGYSQYANFTQSGFAFGNAAQVGLLNVTGFNVSSMSGYFAYEQLMGSSLDMRTFVFSSPYSPPPSPSGNPTDGSAWLNSIGLNTFPGPQPIVSIVAPLTDLFTSKYFPNDPDIEAKGLAVDAFINFQYCSTISSPYPCKYVNPETIVTHFSTSTCPSGWSPFQAGAGRLLVPVDNTMNMPAGVTTGTALLDLQDPSHVHSLAVPFVIPWGPTGSIPATGTSFLNSGNYQFLGTTNSNTSGLPLMQVTTCVLPSANIIPSNYTFPVGGYAFFDPSATPECPSDWSLVTEFPYGYTLVPNSISATGASTSPVSIGNFLGGHTHSFVGIVATPGDNSYCGSTLGNNGPARDDGDIIVSGPTDSATTSLLPYMSMLMCQYTPRISPVGLSVPGMLVYATSCASLDGGSSSWSPFSEYNGYFIMSNPMGGHAGMPYGSGPPIAPNSSNIYSNPHTHRNASSAYVPSTCIDYVVDDQCWSCVNGGFKCNQQNPQCTNPIVESSFVTGLQGDAFPPFVQLQLCVKI